MASRAPASSHRRRLIGRLALAVVVVAVVLATLRGVGELIPDLNPFASETKDRSQPVVLKALERLTEYRAATANLEVIVDVEEDAKYLPDFLKGERTLLVAAGRVDGSVDFGGLDRRAVTVSDDRRTVTLTLPPARLSKAQLDLSRTRVYDRQRGVLDRVGGLVDENTDRDRALFALAERKLTEAAQVNGQVRVAAERNTRQMLTNLLRGLGFDRVSVRFGRPAE